MDENNKFDVVGTNIAEKATMIWNVADMLRGPFKPHEYGLVILPMTVVKRFHDCLLPTHKAVLEQYEKVKNFAVIDGFLAKASGYQFYNISKYTFESLLADPENIEANFRDYLNGFSANVQDVLAKFDFDNIIRRMVESNTLYLVIKEFNSQKGYLGPDKISAVDCGYIFEDLVKRFSESFGEEAGAHFTSRDIIYLMTDLLLSDADLSINKNLAKIEQEFLNQQIDIGLVEPRFDSIASSLRAWFKPKWLLINKSDSVYEKATEYYQNHKEIKKMQADTRGIYFESSILEDQMDIDAEVSSRIKELANSSFELYQNGLGYNNLLFMSAVLGDMAIEKGGIYHNLLLIEEPEAHLHPQLQELVHSFLEDANRNDSNIQIIYTSHSPTLASKIDIENINLIYECGHEKFCLPFSEAKLNEDNKKYLQRYLDVTKSQMFFARGILFVEGISEAILIPEMAKALDRPLEKYAVELVNVDSVAFKPFVNLFSSEQVKTCFKKVSIITDDDRCSKKNEKDYISKDFDYDNVSSEIVANLENGQPSDRYKELETLCSGTEINIFSAYKTLEYALCCSENNIYHMVEAIKNCYVDLGPKLEEKIATLSELSEKAACVWLFIRTRDKCKGAVAQYISQVISDQKKQKDNKKTIEKEFIIPEYLKDAIYSVTEKKL